MFCDFFCFVYFLVLHTHRAGTNVDSENLSNALNNLHFSVSIYKDCTRRDLLEHIREVSTMDHGDYDCILIAILSHGEHGYIYSRDSHYKLDEVTSHFTADRCPSLAGKPKVCRSLDGI